MKKETYDIAKVIVEKIEAIDKRNEVFDDFTAGHEKFTMNLTVKQTLGASITQSLPIDNITNEEISEIFQLLTDLRTKEKEDLEAKLHDL